MQGASQTSLPHTGDNCPAHETLLSGIKALFGSLKIYEVCSVHQAFYHFNFQKRQLIFPVHLGCFSKIAGTRRQFCGATVVYGLNLK